MTIHILGCGPSGQDYKANGDRCIGVNDAAKFGQPFSDLLLINSPTQFVLERQEVIRGTQAERFIILHTIVDSWKQFGIEATHKIYPTLMPGNHNLTLDQCYFTNNSPFTAMTYAVTQGATDIVLWGVDFEGHRFLRFQDSAPDFTRYAQWLRPKGIRIYKGSNKSRLVLEVWKPS